MDHHDRQRRYEEILAIPAPERRSELPELYAELERFGLDFDAPMITEEDLPRDHVQHVVDCNVLPSETPTELP